MAANPISSLKRHFPGTGNSYQIAHDGECLIIKNVEIKGRLYDIKIRQKDEHGQIVKTSKEDQYYQGAIVRIAQAASELFSHLEHDYIPTTKFTFSNAGQDPAEKYSCSTEDMMNESDDESGVWKLYSGQDLSKVGDKPEFAKVVQSAATIHSILFDDTGLVAGDDSDLISPVFEHKVEWDRSKYLRHEEFLVEEEEEDDDDVDEDGASVDLTQDHESPLPIEGGESAEAELVGVHNESEVGEEDDEGYETALSGASSPAVPEGPQEPAWLQDLTFESLVEYSKNPTESGPHPKPYHHFSNLLVNPNSSDGDDQEMLSWLRRLYVQKYNQKTQAAWSKRGMRAISFEDWRKDVSAKEIAHGIILPGTRRNKLVTALKETDIQMFSGI